MTFTRFYRVYCHPRDDKGGLDRQPKGPTERPIDERGVFFFAWRLRRLRDDLIEVLWLRERERRERLEKDRGGKDVE